MIILVDLLRKTCELLHFGSDRMPALLGLSVISIMTGIAALAIVKVTTNQKKVGTARDRMSAFIYEARIFLDSPKRVLASQWQLIKWSGKYVGLTLPALVLIFIPLGLEFLHLMIRYEYAPFEAGQEVLMRLELEEGTKAESVTLSSAPTGIELSAPPLFVDDERLMYFRLHVKAPGVYALELDASGEKVQKLVVAKPDEVRVSAERRGGIAALWAMGYEPGIPSNAGIRSITLNHPIRSTNYLWMPWWLFWMVISIVAALLLKGPLGVEI